MPKKSKKSKSKRMTLRQKYKVLRKVKEHARQKRKDESKARRSGKPVKKAVKDPGLPAAWPYKEDLVKEYAFLRAQALADDKRKKEERKSSAQARDVRALEGAEGDEARAELLGLAKLQAYAAHKAADFETRKRARLTGDFTSDQDNSRKAFYKEFKRVVEASDVIIQVLDARDPLACRCTDVERYIRQTNPDKKIILLLNKMDLVPREVGERWLKYFREELPTVAFKCSTQQQDRGLAQRRMPKPASKAAPGAASDALQGSSCLGAETLLQLLKNYTRNAGIKTSITVGVVGLPNVGKSSLINSLKRARVAQVGNTPGVTKSVQEVVLDKHIKLLDSPGVIFANADSDAGAALRNAIKVEKLADPLSPVGEILKRIPAKKLVVLYKIQGFTTCDEFLQLIAQARGKLRRGGVPDMAAAARIVLQDWNDGRIPYFTQPPSRPVTGLESAEVVAAWSKDFNADEVFAAEQSAVIAHLPGLHDDAAPDYMEAETAGEMRADPALATAMEQDDDDDSGDEAGTSGMEDDDGEDGLVAAAAAALRRREAAKASAQGGQVAALYSEEGQFNPHAARLDRKKQKKARASDAAEGDEGAAAAGVSGSAASAAAKKRNRGAKQLKKKAKHAYGGDSDDDDDAAGGDGDFDFDAMNAEEKAEAEEAGGSSSDEGEEGEEDDDEGEEGEDDEGEEEEEEGGMSSD